MGKEKPRAAWIDYAAGGILTIMELRERGIELCVTNTLSDFQGKFSLENFPVLLFHPGISHQHEVGEIRTKYPQLAFALVTNPLGRSDYKAFRGKSDLLIFGYEETDAIEGFIRKNQRKRDE